MSPEINALILGSIAIGIGLAVLLIDWLEKRKAST